jgi:hypothetical protein
LSLRPLKPGGPRGLSDLVARLDTLELPQASEKEPRPVDLMTSAELRRELAEMLAGPHGDEYRRELDRLGLLHEVRPRPLFGDSP